MMANTTDDFLREITGLFEETKADEDEALALGQRIKEIDLQHLSFHLLENFQLVPWDFFGVYLVQKCESNRLKRFVQNLSRCFQRELIEFCVHLVPPGCTS